VLHRFEAGKLAEGWFLGDEVSICRQIGIKVAIPPVSAAPVALTPGLVAPPAASASDIAARQRPGIDYGVLKSTVTRLAPERRSSAALTGEERTNLDCYLKYKTAKPNERANYQTATYKGHRRGIVHLPELRGAPGVELDHGALEGRLDEIEDVIVKGDRLWSAFTLRAKHVGPLYGVSPTGNTIEMPEFCVMRFEAGKIAEAWFFGDELGVCRQLGIPIVVNQGS
jgi:predicted ester cyclase